MPARARPTSALARPSAGRHAWGDSNLYLRRRGDTLLLTVEHRAAPSTSGVALELRADGNALALSVVDPVPDPLPNKGPRPVPSTASNTPSRTRPGRSACASFATSAACAWPPSATSSRPSGPRAASSRLAAATNSPRRRALPLRGSSFYTHRETETGNTPSHSVIAGPSGSAPTLNKDVRDTGRRSERSEMWSGHGSHGV
jgi:hypothetical protein